MNYVTLHEEFGTTLAGILEGNAVDLELDRIAAAAADSVLEKMEGKGKG
jgi:hypothetical protein